MNCCFPSFIPDLLWSNQVCLQQLRSCGTSTPHTPQSGYTCDQVSNLLSFVFNAEQSHMGDLRRKLLKTTPPGLWNNISFLRGIWRLGSSLASQTFFHAALLACDAHFLRVSLIVLHTPFCFRHFCHYFMFARLKSGRLSGRHSCAPVSGAPYRERLAQFRDPRYP